VAVSFIGGGPGKSHLILDLYGCSKDEERDK
jgi:hypothetical protein